jgi:hypothetical protein
LVRLWFVWSVLAGRMMVPGVDFAGFFFCSGGTFL